MREEKKGKVWLVGAGPSDAGLLTIKGKRLLEKADVVVYDKLIGRGVMALIPDGVRMIPVGKTAGHHPIPQHEINRILLDEALRGNRVVRLERRRPVCIREEEEKSWSSSGKTIYPLRSFPV